MDLLHSCYSFLYHFNGYLALPTLLLFVGTGIFFTVRTGFLQIRGFPVFWHLITHGITKSHDTKAKTISAFQALFTALATTIGMGNIVGPSMAISIGGPGALLWLLLYIIIGSVTKFAEVTYAVNFRTLSPRGDVIGGPTQYLKHIHPFFEKWYGFLTVILFTVWASLQVNTISCIWAQEGIPQWFTGLLVESILLAVVLGGVKRIGFFASAVVPVKFILYIVFAVLILAQNPWGVFLALKSIFSCAFSMNAACGGLIGATFFTALREGIYKSIFITESGVGTASISHALANVEYPSDQGILALFSSIADFFLCLLSGLVTIVTGVWLSGKMSNTLIYEAFKSHSPIPGSQYILIVSVFLFVITALIGNAYNGSQSLAAITSYKYIKYYYFIAAIIGFTGALVAVPFIWNLMDIILTFVALPNLIGLIILSFKFPHILKIHKRDVRP